MQINELDSLVAQLQERLGQKKAELEEQKSEISGPWKTNCSWIVEEKTINLQTANTRVLVGALAELLQVVDYRTRAAELLGIEYTFELWGYSMEDWISDFRKRGAIIKHKDQQEDLKQLEDRVASVMSEQQKRAAEIQALTKDLGL